MAVRVLAETGQKSQTLIYLKTLMADRYVASVTPSSRFAVEKICRKIDFGRHLTLVEYGPGTGVFTRRILAKMSCRSRLIAIERNRNFHRHLKERIDDPRLILLHDSAENVLSLLERYGQGQADYVLSGIPFSFLSGPARRAIVENTHAALRQGGRFLAYQTFFQQKSHLQAHLECFFDVFPLSYVLLCLPPLAIYEATKG